ncbi:unnamed protein product [Pieris brassicae]|uniref:MADF domain-containing protein n=1 Tax=Pieris brassicae TaxID=7116 RepID=A0A9P0TLJ9_PIEBR|nr:unnamed protein product [Pieris brassicae]
MGWEPPAGKSARSKDFVRRSLACPVRAPPHYLPLPPSSSNRFLIAIYDKKFKECSDSKFKIKAWNDISGIIFSTVWGTLSSQERNKAGKLVQKRWKNLRACFLRELREQKCTKSDQAATKRRKYNHFDQLLFLIPSLDTRETSGNADSVEEINCEEDSQDASREVRQREEYFRKKNKNKICYEERLLEIFNNKRVDDNKFIEAMRNNVTVMTMTRKGILRCLWGRC